MSAFNPFTALGRLDFRRPHPWLNPGAVLMATALCAALGWVADGASKIQDGAAAVDGINERIERRQSELKALARKAASQSPGDKAWQQMLARHAATSLPVLAHIESAWEPRIALLSLTVRGGGREAQLEGVARELDQIQAFLTRLDTAGAKQVALQRISNRAEGTDRVFQFTLHVQMP